MLRTTFLLAVLTVILVLGGNALGGAAGMKIALLLALAMNFGSYWFSDKVVLKLYRGREVSRAEAPELHALVRELAQRVGLPMPRLYLIASPAANAFATGRDPQHAALAVTTGLLRLLDRDELAGVLGHELAHIQHRDILIGSIAATLAGAVTMLANMARWALIFGGGREDDRDGGGVGLLVMALLAPVAALIVQMAVSRSREYAADQGGARIAGEPRHLVRALAKLARGAEAMPLEAHPATAHLFIVNPLRGGLASLFSTHPPLEERIRRLEAMCG